MEMQAPLGASTTKGALEADRGMRRPRSQTRLHQGREQFKIIGVDSSVFFSTMAPAAAQRDLVKLRMCHVLDCPQ
jgi:hypothetical protein